MEAALKIYNGLLNGCPVAEAIEDCLAEAARRGDERVQAWLGFECADNSSMQDSDKNMRSIKLRLEASGMEGVEIEKALVRYLEGYTGRRSTSDGRIISLPIAKLEELRDSAQGRADALMARMPFVPAAELTRISGKSKKLLDFIADADAVLGATRSALAAYIKENWLGAPMPADVAGAQLKAQPEFVPISPERITMTEDKPGQAPKQARDNGESAVDELPGDTEKPGDMKKPGDIEKPGDMKKPGGADIPGAAGEVLLVSLESPHERAAAALLQKLGVGYTLARSVKELGDMAECGLNACMGVVLAHGDTDDALARIGYCLGVLNTRLGQQSTCLLVEQSAMASRLSVFARQIRLHFYETPEECERLLGMLIDSAFR